ncbi:phosphorylated adapter RNA export protein [Citrus sinensis]|uniref:Phosphorylated adapter RNA export protein n=1 Tax=Citrus sinensis TaxID=2711 RepID=A0ACB8NPT4_CITSI|nr:phosphorylated adapter RNA export protein [Citrus sinensis]
MDEGESILGVIYEDSEDNLEDGEDVEMLDVEEGELVEHNSSSQTNVEQSSSGDVSAGNQGSQSKNRRRRANKKKNKKKRSGPGPNVTDVNRFVSDTCKRLKEKKSYMVYTAVGCLGIPALSDLVKEHYADVGPESVMLVLNTSGNDVTLSPEVSPLREFNWYIHGDMEFMLENLCYGMWSLLVEAIQACGGQMTADSRRFRTGGGVLWNIIKARAPGAYKEIIKKTKEFENFWLLSSFFFTPTVKWHCYSSGEKQFRQQNNRQVPEQNNRHAPEQIKEASTQRTVGAPTDGTSVSILGGGSQSVPQDQDGKSGAEGKPKSVHDRIRVPVSYDDLLAEDPKNDSI